MRLQFYVTEELASRVERVGALLGHPKGRAAAFLLDNASQIESRAIAAIESAPASCIAGDSTAKRGG